MVITFIAVAIPPLVQPNSMAHVRRGHVIGHEHPREDGHAVDLDVPPNRLRRLSSTFTKEAYTTDHE